MDAAHRLAPQHTIGRMASFAVTSGVAGSRGGQAPDSGMPQLCLLPTTYRAATAASRPEARDAASGSWSTTRELPGWQISGAAPSEKEAPLRQRGGKAKQSPRSRAKPRD